MEILASWKERSPVPGSRAREVLFIRRDGEDPEIWADDGQSLATFKVTPEDLSDFRGVVDIALEKAIGGDNVNPDEFHLLEIGIGTARGIVDELDRRKVVDGESFDILWPIGSVSREPVEIEEWAVSAYATRTYVTRRIHGAEVRVYLRMAGARLRRLGGG